MERRISGGDKDVHPASTSGILFYVIVILASLVAANLWLYSKLFVPFSVDFLEIIYFFTKKL